MVLIPYQLIFQEDFAIVKNWLEIQPSKILALHFWYCHYLELHELCPRYHLTAIQRRTLLSVFYREFLCLMSPPFECNDSDKGPLSLRRNGWFQFFYWKCDQTNPQLGAHQVKIDTYQRHLQRLLNLLRSECLWGWRGTFWKEKLSCLWG